MRILNFKTANIATGITFLFLMLFFTSCNEEKKTEQQASADLNKIDSLISAENYQAAKMAIDSFHVVYRKKVELRKKADILSDTIDLRESRKNISYLNSILPEKIKRLNDLKQNFNLTEYEKQAGPGIYQHKNHDAVANANRNYIHSYFDENGLLYLVSDYTGKNIRHNQLQISTGDLSVSTGALSSGNYYDVQGEHFEKISVGDSAAINLIEFIVANQKQNLKVALKGNGGFSYILQQNDKRIIAETYEFWKLKTETDKINKELTRANKRIQIIELKKQ